MVDLANSNLVHESEAQRQHARVNLPAKLQLKIGDGELYRYTVKDISAGGFRLKLTDQELDLNSQLEGSLVFKINTLEILMEVSFQVKSINPDGFFGCEFQSLTPQDISTLRFLITSHLSGELIAVGDVINTLSRENFTNARADRSKLNQMSAYARFKSIVISLGIFSVGLAALTFICLNLYHNFFVTVANTAVVKMNTVEIALPRDGKLNSLIPADGLVKFGQPIISYETAMLDALKGHLANEDLSEANITALFSQQLTGTVSSPCNCQLQKQTIADGQFATKGSTVLQLVPIDDIPYVEAIFNTADALLVTPGATVDITIAGIDHPVSGVIQDAVVSATGDKIVATIQPGESLPISLADRVVTVSITNSSGQLLP